MAQLNDLGIDLGTSNVLIYQQGKGLVLRRPAVVAIERSTKKVLAIGDDAQRMVGRTPSNIMAIRPLKQGTVADFELTNTMLRFFLNGVLSKRLFSGAARRHERPFRRDRDGKALPHQHPAGRGREAYLSA